MKKNLIYLLILLQFILLSCSRTSDDSILPDSNKTLIYVTIPPQKSIIKAIGGEYVDIAVLVPSNMDPHDYQPKPQQILNLENTPAFFQIGLPLENILKPKLKEINPKINFYNMNYGVSPIIHKINGVAIRDPHIWLSPKDLKIIAKNSYEYLVTIIPKYKKTFYKNYINYISKLDSAYTQLKQILTPYKGRTFFVFHPAFGYFARDFGLKQQAVEIDGLTPSPKELLFLIEKAKKIGVKIIFVEPQFSQKTAEALANKINGNVILINPLSEDIISNLKKFADKLQYSFSLENN